MPFDKNYVDVADIIILNINRIIGWINEINENILTNDFKTEFQKLKFFQKPGTDFKTWSEELTLLLIEHKVYSYIEEERLKKIPSNNIKKENLSKYIKVRGDKSKVYHSSVTEEMILKDNTAKTLINNSINYENKKKLNFITSTAHEIYKTLKDTYAYADSERKEILLKELDDLIFDSKKSSISMFISSMNNIFSELENLGITKSDKEKFDYLFNAIPKQLIYMSNLLRHKND
ncbi:hypothetical protein BCR32DRAFT_286940 [Anaeromyces robustus]|uniref:Uncharacterized protein n=1 Tax=Anaeromyces robustus TaxID=1754192 RepID=A0A1Y1VUI8_9FUNG|nr:hypothetical protein BCR32DRAFT_286940 [Anaeromyces robustus]|eukprot:ORX64676.1 hypothetical protein BCR32DRAFT_286940 [Anaeromyces robustus]